VAATKAALEEGVVPGGGVALFKAREVLVEDHSKVELSKDKDVKQIFEYMDWGSKGFQILYAALEAPIKGILGNSGRDLVWVTNTLRELANYSGVNKNNYGFDVVSMEFTDMIKRGIIDPAKVTRLALQNAASVATMILTTEALVTDIPEEKPAMPSPDGGMGGMGGMY